MERHGQDWPPGFTTLALLILINISLTSVFLGILGEYVSRIFTQIKQQPITIDAGQKPEAVIAA